MYNKCKKHGVYNIILFNNSFVGFLFLDFHLTGILNLFPKKTLRLQLLRHVDEDERRQILSGILAKLRTTLGDNSRDLDAWVAGSPLVEVTLNIS